MQEERFAEAIVMAYHRVHDVDTAIVRIFNTYGPRMRLNDGRALPAFMSQALRGEDLTVFGDGSQTRDFVHVSDVVRAMLLAGEREDPVGQVVNVGSGQSISILALAEALRMQFPGGAEPSFSSPREGDLAQSVADMDRADRALGYRPKIAIEQGLQATIEWFEASNNEQLS